MYAGHRWGSDKTIKFVELYEKYPCLWDVESEAYKSRMTRESAYKKIADEMGEPIMDISSVKSKIRVFRNTYNLEVSKIKKSIHAGADEIYKPKIAWFKVMDRILKRNCFEDMPFNTEFKCETYISEEEASDASSTHSYSKKYEPSSKFRKIEVNDPINIQMQVPQEITFKEISKQETRNENEFDAFGRNVSLQLQQLPLKEALETQEFILRELRKQRLKAVAKEEEKYTWQENSSMTLRSSSKVNHDHAIRDEDTYTDDE